MQPQRYPASHIGMILFARNIKNHTIHKLGNLKSELIQEQDNLKKIKADGVLKFKSECNHIRHTLNEKVLESLYK
jgi:hypothetical protein